MPFGNAVSRRIGWVDVAKGIGIILIVVGHANWSIDRSSFLTWTDALKTLDTVLYSFHVPLFFVLAGVSSKLARSGWRNGAGSLIIGIIIPYIIWSIIWILCKSLLPGGVVNISLQLSDLWHILWMPVDHFWFLYHLALIRFIWLLAESWLDRTQQMAVFVVLVAASHGLRFIAGEWLALAHFIENTAFFGFGFLLLQQLMSGVSRLGRMVMVSLVVFVGLLSVKWIGEVSTLRFLTAIAGASMVIFAAATLDKSSWGAFSGWLVRIGQASLVIFLLHVFAIGLVRLLLSKNGLLENEMLLFWGTVAGVGFPYLAYVVVRWISDQLGKPVLTWIGFGRWQQGVVGSAA